MTSTDGVRRVNIMFLLLILYTFFITVYSDDKLELRGEPILKKPLTNNAHVYASIKKETSTSKIVFDSKSGTSPKNTKTTTGIANDNISENNKQINKRQQYSQAKPLLDVQNGKYDPKNQRGNSCPLCDSSVFSYCSDKLLHDACCCLNPYETNLPYQCQYADCNFLHANSCREHHLITSCCCDRYLFTV